jgi:NAD(P)-dependent dehydrogenase (short-subunit alcohol dehydrogenase family)
LVTPNQSLHSATYTVYGGAKGVGLVLSNFLARSHLGATLVLASRNPVPSFEDSCQLACPAGRDADVAVWSVEVDVGDPEAMREVLINMKNKI